MIEVFNLPWPKSCPSCQGFSRERADAFPVLRALRVYQLALQGGLLKMQASIHCIRVPGRNLLPQDHLHPGENTDVRSFPTTHLRKGNSVSFCSWCGRTTGDREKEARDERHWASTRWASPTSQYSWGLARPWPFRCTLMLSWISIRVGSF